MMVGHFVFLLMLAAVYAFVQPDRPLSRPKWKPQLTSSNTELESANPLDTVSQFMGRLFSREEDNNEKKWVPGNNVSEMTPAWKLLEDSMEQNEVDGGGEGEDTKVESTSGGSDSNSLSSPDYSVDEMSAEGFEFDDRDFEGPFTGVRRGLGKVGSGVAGVGRRLIPWSERNKDVRQKNRAAKVDEETSILSEGQQGRGPSVLGRVGLTFRRRLLNLFDKGDDALKWAKIMDKVTVADTTIISRDFELLQKQFRYSQQGSALPSEESSSSANKMASADSIRATKSAPRGSSGPISFVRDNALGVLYWSVGKEYAPKKDPVAPRGVLRRRLQLRSDSSQVVVKKLSQIDKPREGRTRNFLSRIGSRVRDAGFGARKFLGFGTDRSPVIMKEAVGLAASDVVEAYQRDLEKKREEEGADSGRGDEVASNAQEEPSLSSVVREKGGGEDFLGGLGRGIQRLLPWSNSSPSPSSSTETFSPKATAEQTALSLQSLNDSSLEGEAEGEGEGEGEEEVDPTDIDSDKDGGPQWPWKRFYGSAKEKMKDGKDEGEKAADTSTSTTIVSGGTDTGAASSSASSSSNADLVPDLVKTAGSLASNADASFRANMIRTLKLPGWDRDKDEGGDEYNKPVLRLLREGEQQQSGDDAGQKATVVSRALDSVGGEAEKVGAVTARVFPVSAKVLSVARRGVSTIGEYMPGVAVAARATGWLADRVGGAGDGSTSGASTSVVENGPIRGTLDTRAVSQREASYSGVLGSPSLASFVDMAGVQGFPVTSAETEANTAASIEAGGVSGSSADGGAGAVMESQVAYLEQEIELGPPGGRGGEEGAVLRGKETILGEKDGGAPGGIKDGAAAASGASTEDARESLAAYFGAQGARRGMAAEASSGVPATAAASTAADAPSTSSGGGGGWGSPGDFKYASAMASSVYSGVNSAAQLAQYAVKNFPAGASGASAGQGSREDVKGTGAGTPEASTSAVATAEAMQRFSEDVQGFSPAGQDMPLIRFPSAPEPGKGKSGNSGGGGGVLGGVFSRGGEKRDTDPDHMQVKSDVAVTKDSDLARLPDTIVPAPSQEDFDFIIEARILTSVSAANVITTDEDGKEFLKDVGLEPLVTALVGADKFPHLPALQLQAVKGLCRLVRADVSAAATVMQRHPQVLEVLAEIIEAPFKGFRSLRSQEDREKEKIAQYEATALVQRMVRSSDAAVVVMRQHKGLTRALHALMDSPDEEADSLPGPSLRSLRQTSKDLYNSQETSLKPIKGLKPANTTKVIDYKGIKARDMARVASWGLGGVKWRPRQPNQKGLRILSFDGGGTKGVLTIAVLKEIIRLVGNGQEPHEMFDLICGTSTGGIIATVLGLQQKGVAEMEVLYDEFIGKVFGKGSNIKLVSEKAFYDESELEKVLYDICGEELLLDSNIQDSPRVFSVSTKVNENPPKTQIWRNYNYPPQGSNSRYPGAFRVNTLTAVRATTAAPTFFTPVQWENGLYCDGALVANNPCAIALQEAKLLYPGVPIELVISIGTGHNSQSTESTEGMGWDLLTSVIINSSTDTEETDRLLMNFLPPDKYFRFNPVLDEKFDIDVKDKKVLDSLKEVGKGAIETMASTAEGKKRKDTMIRLLKGK